MKMIGLQEIFRKTPDASKYETGCLVFKSGKKLLIGPRLSSSFCPDCFKKRMLSSEFIEEFAYKDITEKDMVQIHSLISSRVILRKKEILEFQGDTLIARHFLLEVPGCLHTRNG